MIAGDEFEEIACSSPESAAVVQIGRIGGAAIVTTGAGAAGGDAETVRFASFRR